MSTHALDDEVEHEARLHSSWWERAIGRVRRWPWHVVLAFAIAFAATLLVAMLQSETFFYNDSGYYWQMGTTFTVSGHFSLLNFSDPEKGYALALIYYGLQTLAADFAWTASSIVKVFNAFTFALIGTVLGPALIRAVWPTQPSWGIGRRLALAALLIAFWDGFLNVPLSDFPALAGALLALVAVSRTDSPGWMLIAGLMLSLTVNIRTAYSTLIPVVIALVFWEWYRQRGTKHASTARRALCLGLLLVGFVIVALPQSLSAHRYRGTWNFVPGAGVLDVTGIVYTGGLKVQETDTYVLPEGRSEGMIYGYPAGQRLLAEQKEGKIASASQYYELFVSHPLVMGGLIVRHFINGLDPLYSSPYVDDIQSELRTPRRIAAFLLMFIALLRVLWPVARRRLGRARLWYLVALGLCCVTTLPTIMERRYLLPVYILIYILALTPSWPRPVASGETSLRRFRPATAIAVSFIAFTAVVWYITNDAISHLVVGN